MGSGLGTFAELLKDRDLITVEPDITRCTNLRKQFRKVAYGCLANIKENDFDTITYINVLEHILHDEMELKTVEIITIENIKITRTLSIITNTDSHRSKAFEFFYKELWLLKNL